MRWFHETTVSAEVATPVLAAAGYERPSESMRALDLARRPGVNATALARAAGAGLDARDEEALAAVEVEIRYEGYVRRERERAERLREQEGFSLPSGLPYERFISLSTEARQKLARIRPETLGQAGRIPGVSPSDLHNLVLEVRRHARDRASAVP
jgi:tRNA uridine 5-carboxymethylaminomethyl modification enzyme